MEYVPHIPGRAPVAPAVELIFDLTGYLPGQSRERMVPNGRMHLVIELDGRPRQIYDNQTGAPCPLTQSKPSAFSSSTTIA